MQIFWRRFFSFRFGNAISIYMMLKQSIYSRRNIFRQRFGFWVSAKKSRKFCNFKISLPISPISFPVRTHSNLGYMCVIIPENSYSMVVYKMLPGIFGSTCEFSICCAVMRTYDTTRNPCQRCDVILICNIAIIWRGERE